MKKLHIAALVITTSLCSAQEKAGEVKDCTGFREFSWGEAYEQVRKLCPPDTESTATTITTKQLLIWEERILERAVSVQLEVFDEIFPEAMFPDAAMYTEFTKDFVQIGCRAGLHQAIISFNNLDWQEATQVLSKLKFQLEQKYQNESEETYTGDRESFLSMENQIQMGNAALVYSMNFESGSILCGITDNSALSFVVQVVYRSHCYEVYQTLAEHRELEDKL